MNTVSRFTRDRIPYLYYDDISDPDDHGWVLMAWWPGEDTPRPHALTITDRADIQAAMEEAARTHRIPIEQIALLDSNEI